MTEATLFLDLDGTILQPEEAALLQNPLIGGIILFGRNTESAEQVAELVRCVRAVRPELIISLDQEGGRVQRLRQGVARLPAVKALADDYKRHPQQGLEQAADLAYLMAAELRQLDVDLSFAPVLDVDYGRNTVIGDRAFADNAEDVCALSRAYIQGMQDAGMVATVKHFPGHGWADADTHLHDALDEREFGQLWDSDLLPFRRAVEQGVAAMMFAHVLYPRCDAAPAGFSSFWLQEVLRQKLGFTGVIFSDDLSMKAAHAVGGYADRARHALAAGCQALLCCNERQGTLEILEYLESSGCRPLSSISRLKGAQWQLQPERLLRGQQLAQRLLGD
ncbi:beta-N-acetylhexosaminidase [Neptuniibacter halophilus]|uniref:beta-N-acetylhexosaminidase n=1 Tax=Neptuniibacter halophilus TaxID=651666 RepID=UPI002572D1BA|nr:beta-N-acetylhexosaminidase [Neptuniibacter halophilus]